MFGVVALCMTACKKDDLDGKVSLGVAYEPTTTAKSHIEGFTIVFDADDTIKLTPKRWFTLEEALEFIADDELIEVTPKSIRIRKRILDNATRMKEKMKDRK